MELSCMLRINAPKESIWPYYVNPEKRKRWEEDLESLTIEGPLATGTEGRMKLKGMPEMKFILAKIVENASHWDKVEVPGKGSLVFKHDIQESDGNTFVTHTLCMEGDAEDEHTALFLQKIFADVPLEMMKIKHEVE